MNSQITCSWLGYRIRHLVISCLLLPISLHANVKDSVLVWRTMNENSFTGSIYGANGVEGQDIRLGLSENEREEHIQMLAQGLCKNLVVPDGTIYEKVNRVSRGKPGTQGRTLKKMGKDITVIRCSLASGKVLDWYTGFDGACNNVALNPNIPKEDTEWFCADVPFDGNYDREPNESFYLHGVYHEGYCRHDDMYIPSFYWGGLQESEITQRNGSAEECWPIEK